MTQDPYDYTTRQGVLPISWEHVHSLCKGLAQAVAPFQPEIILAVGRGGFYPGALIAHLLQVEPYPVRVSRRVNDVVRYESPQWLVEPPAQVRGRRVLVVDEIASSGETLRVVCQRVAELGAQAVRSAVLYAHTWGVEVPDYIGLVSDALLMNPWDREIWRDGAFHFHPEYVEALHLQGVQPDPSLLVSAPPLPPAKSAPSP